MASISAITSGCAPVLTVHSNVARLGSNAVPHTHPLPAQVLPSSLRGIPLHAALVKGRPCTTPENAFATRAAFSAEKCSCCRRDVLSGLALSLAALSSGPAEAAGGKVAVAELVPTKGSSAKGKVTFTEQGGFFGGKSVKVDVDISGLSPGLHGFHIHEFGNVTCDDGLCTGGHFNPSKRPHGSPGDKERHVGDLGNILADKDGKVKTTLKDTVICLEGAESIVGHSVVVHFGQDDLKSQPSGNAGGRAAYATVQLV